MKSTFLRAFILFAILCTGVLFAGACSCRSAKDKRSSIDDPEYLYVTAPKALLKLERGFKQLRYHAGVPGQKMEFKLSNSSLDKRVSIEEWFGREDENIKIYVAPCEKGRSSEVSAQDWKQVHPYISKKTGKLRKHYKSPVTLQPNNAILIETELKFLEDFRMEGKPSVYFAVKAELDLLTVEASTDVFEIEVVPNVKVEITPDDK